MPALAAVAGLDVVALAALALFLLIGYAPLQRPLLQALGTLPLVGAAVAGRVEQMLSLAVGFAAEWAQWAISPAADFVARLAAALVYFSGHTADAVEQLAYSVYRTAYQALPAAEARAERYAEQLAAAEFAYTVSAVADAERYALGLTLQAEAFAEQLAAQEVQLTLEVGQQAEQLAEQLTQQAITYTQQAVTQAEQLAIGAAGQSEDYARQLVQDALAYTQTVVLGAERYAEGIGIADRDYAAQVGRQAEAYAGQLGAAIAAAAAAADAAVLSRVQAIEDSPCQRFCSPLGDLGQLLQGLEDAGLLAILLGLVQEARQHPDQVVGLIDSTIGAAGRDAARALQLGIPG